MEGPQVVLVNDLMKIVKELVGIIGSLEERVSKLEKELNSNA